MREGSRREKQREEKRENGEWRRERVDESNESWSNYNF